MPTITTLPPRKFVRRAEAEGYLSQVVFRDAVAAGKLKPVCRKNGASRATTALFFSRDDVINIEAEILAGKYPGQAAA